MQEVFLRLVYQHPTRVDGRFANDVCFRVENAIRANQRVSCFLPTALNTAPYGSTGSAHVLLACRYLVLALSSFISVYY